MWTQLVTKTTRDGTPLDLLHELNQPFLKILLNSVSRWSSIMADPSMSFASMPCFLKASCLTCYQCFLRSCVKHRPTFLVLGCSTVLGKKYEIK